MSAFETLVEELEAAQHELAEGEASGDGWLTLTPEDVETMRAAADRLALLDRWLEARGLPVDAPVEDWDKWRWVILRGGDGAAVGLGSILSDDAVDCSVTENWTRDMARHYSEDYRVLIRWDCATDAQKAEALRLEKERG